MPNSLNAGIHQKKDRLAKITQVIRSAVLSVESGGQLTKAAGARVRFVPQANPATCTVGELNVDAANKLNICTAANTWTVVGTQA